MYYCRPDPAWTAPAAPAPPSVMVSSMFAPAEPITDPEILHATAIAEGREMFDRVPWWMWLAAGYFIARGKRRR